MGRSTLSSTIIGVVPKESEESVSVLSSTIIAVVLKELKESIH